MFFLLPRRLIDSGVLLTLASHVSGNSMIAGLRRKEMQRGPRRLCKRDGADVMRSAAAPLARR